MSVQIVTRNSKSKFDSTFTSRDFTQRERILTSKNDLKSTFVSLNNTFVVSGAIFVTRVLWSGID